MLYLSRTAIALIASLAMTTAPLWAADDVKKPGFHGWGDSQAVQEKPAEIQTEAEQPDAASRIETDDPVDRERAAFIEDTRPLRREIYQKQLELRSELAKPDPDAERATTLQQEISDRRAQLERKRLEHFFKMKKLDPDLGRGGYGACPNCPYRDPERGFGKGDSMMGPGGWGHHMWDGRGYGRGRHMMGPGYGRHHMWGRGYGMDYEGRDQGPGRMEKEPTPRASDDAQELSQSDARDIVAAYLESTRNPNLTLGKITDAGEAYEAEILTRDGSLVDKVMVDKQSGYMRPAY
jgi:hypothetical protein